MHSIATVACVQECAWRTRAGMLVGGCLPCLSHLPAHARSEHTTSIALPQRRNLDVCSILHGEILQIQKCAMLLAPTRCCGALIFKFLIIATLLNAVFCSAPASYTVLSVYTAV